MPTFGFCQKCFPQYRVEDLRKKLECFDDKLRRFPGQTGQIPQNMKDLIRAANIASVSPSVSPPAQQHLVPQSPGMLPSFHLQGQQTPVRLPVTPEHHPISRSESFASRPQTPALRVEPFGQGSFALPPVQYASAEPSDTICLGCGNSHMLLTEPITPQIVSSRTPAQSPFLGRSPALTPQSPGLAAQSIPQPTPLAEARAAALALMLILSDHYSLPPPVINESTFWVELKPNGSIEAIHVSGYVTFATPQANPRIDETIAMILEILNNAGIHFGKVLDLKFLYKLLLNNVTDRNPRQFFVPNFLFNSDTTVCLSAQRLLDLIATYWQYVYIDGIHIGYLGTPQIEQRQINDIATFFQGFTSPPVDRVLRDMSCRNTPAFTTDLFRELKDVTVNGIQCDPFADVDQLFNLIIYNTSMNRGNICYFPMQSVPPAFIATFRGATWLGRENLRQKRMWHIITENHIMRLISIFERESFNPETNQMAFSRTQSFCILDDTLNPVEVYHTASFEFISAENRPVLFLEQNSDRLTTCCDCRCVETDANKLILMFDLTPQGSRPIKRCLNCARNLIENQMRFAPSAFFPEIPRPRHSQSPQPRISTPHRSPARSPTPQYATLGPEQEAIRYFDGGLMIKGSGAIKRKGMQQSSDPDFCKDMRRVLNSSTINGIPEGHTEEAALKTRAQNLIEQMIRQTQIDSENFKHFPIQQVEGNSYLPFAEEIQTKEGPGRSWVLPSRQRKKKYHIITGSKKIYIIALTESPLMRGEQSGLLIDQGVCVLNDRQSDVPVCFSGIFLENSQAPGLDFNAMPPEGTVCADCGCSTQQEAPLIIMLDIGYEISNNTWVRPVWRCLNCARYLIDYYPKFAAQTAQYHALFAAQTQQTSLRTPSNASFGMLPGGLPPPLVLEGTQSVYAGPPSSGASTPPPDHRQLHHGGPLSPGD